jgi:predicted NBD/HSP70 family sugar kinase
LRREAMTTRSAKLLHAVHARPGVTRAEAARLVGIGTGAATGLVGRLGRAGLLSEGPASPSGRRGRPTTVLLPHPDGPLVAAALITHEIWRVDVVELGGGVLDSLQATHGGARRARAGSGVFGDLADAVRGLERDYGGRILGLGIAAPGIVTGLRLEAPLLGWHALDLAPVGGSLGVVVAGNDATMAASAECARGAAVAARVALHVRIEAGLGGAVVNGADVLVGATGAAGEFGHMPFGDPSVECACGAFGCWGTAVDGAALARLLGSDPPRDSISYARRVIAAAEPGSRELTAVRQIAGALGRGVAGLVTAFDPDVVTIGGLGREILHVARDSADNAYRAGLMRYRRDASPPVIPAQFGEDGPLLGAAEETWSRVIEQLPT